MQICMQSKQLSGWHLARERVRRSNDGSHVNLASLYANSTTGDSIDGFWVQLELELSHTTLHRLSSIAVKDCTGSLSDDGTVIKLVVDKVNCATSELHTHFNHSFVDTFTIKPVTAKRGDQRGMNVGNPVLEVGRYL